MAGAAGVCCHSESICMATWKGEFKLPWREAGPPDHHDDEVDSEQKVVRRVLAGSAGSFFICITLKPRVE